MEPLGGVGHVKSCFSPFGDGISVSARQVRGLRQMYHRLSNRFGRIRWYSAMTRLKWKLISVSLEIVLTLTQYMCMVWTDCTIGSEIVLDAPDGTSWWRGSFGMLFWSDWRQSQHRCKRGARLTWNVLRLRNRFGRTPWYTKWKLVLVRLEIVPILMQDSYMVRTVRT
jgi:hypothetical protein